VILPYQEVAINVRSSNGHTKIPQNFVGFPTRLLKFILNKPKIKELFKRQKKGERPWCSGIYRLLKATNARIPSLPPFSIIL